jgi:EipB-like
MKKILYAVLATLPMVLGSAEALGQVTIVAHRAVYDLTLASSTTRSGISGADGRMVMELTGSACEGWSVNFRRVMELRPNEGDVRLLDTQIASWESGDGLSMRMTQKEYIDNGIQSDTKLSAEFPRRGEAGRGHTELPTPGDFDLSPGTIFPVDHQLRLMTTAEANGARDISYVFDGSSGTKVFKAISFIGKRKESEELPAESPKTIAELARVPSWPVSISFFDVDKDDSSGEELPSYQVSFTLYQNGVAGNLVMDYGDFAVAGKLSGLEFMKQSDCHS